jgi:hypothetical protein
MRSLEFYVHGTDAGNGNLAVPFVHLRSHWLQRIELRQRT